MKITVYHGYYGCDTGCCGHWVSLDGREEFTFDHPNPWRETAPGELWLDLRWNGEGVPPAGVREFVEAAVTETFGAEHVADIDWSRCRVSTE